MLSDRAIQDKNNQVQPRPLLPRRLVVSPVNRTSPPSHRASGSSMCTVLTHLRAGFVANVSLLRECQAHGRRRSDGFEGVASGGHADGSGGVPSGGDSRLHAGILHRQYVKQSPSDRPAGVRLQSRREMSLVAPTRGEMKQNQDRKIKHYRNSSIFSQAYASVKFCRANAVLSVFAMT